VAFAIVTAMLASLVIAPAPAMAAETFNGGPDRFPSFVANDHTPVAVHFAAGGGTGPALAPNTSYYAKIRFTVSSTPSGATNRGYTWNPSTRQWVQERETQPDWSRFPTVTTDGSGRIPDDAGWLFVKFGDDTKAGDYHLMVSLSLTGTSSTSNGSITPTLTVFDPRATGGWVHNGVATGADAARNARATDETSTTVLSMQRTEAQGVDDDADLVVDNEDSGPVGLTGDFRMSVPSATAIRVSLDGAFWSPADSFLTGPADVDLAVGAVDHSAPSAPGSISASSGDGAASLSWTGATDDVAVAGYYVYRWNPAPTGAAYSPMRARVATLGPDATSFDDTDLTNGMRYLYEVRAFDAATNVGPRSGTASATPVVTAPGAAVTPTNPDGEDGWYRTTPVVTLTPSAPGRSTQYSFEATPAQWTPYTGPFEVPDGEHTLYYRETDGVTASAPQAIDFQVDYEPPVTTFSAPTFTVQQTAGRSFTVSWAGVDNASGIASYDVDWKTGASGTWTHLRASTESTSASISGSGGTTYYFRVRAADRAGNAADWTNSAGSSFPNDQSKASFSSGWKTISRSSAFMGSVKYATRSGASASFKLSRGVLYLVAATGPKLGKAAVYFRGKRVATIDTYSKSGKQRQTFKIATFSGSSASTVKVVNLATSHRPRLEIDGFAVRY